MFGFPRKSASKAQQASTIEPRVGDLLPDRMGRQWQVRAITTFGVQVCDVAGSLLGCTFLLTRNELHKLCRTEPTLSAAHDRW